MPRRGTAAHHFGTVHRLRAATAPKTFTVNHQATPRCMAIDSDGAQCPAHAVPFVSSIDLTEGIKLAGLRVIPSMYCCKLCKSHLVAVLAIYAYSAYAKHKGVQKAAHKFLGMLIAGNNENDQPY